MRKRGWRLEERRKQTAYREASGHLPSSAPLIHSYRVLLGWWVRRQKWEYRYVSGGGRGRYEAERVTLPTNSISIPR